MGSGWGVAAAACGLLVSCTPPAPPSAGVERSQDCSNAHLDLRRRIEPPTEPPTANVSGTWSCIGASGNHWDVVQQDDGHVTIVRSGWGGSGSAVTATGTVARDELVYVDGDATGRLKIDGANMDGFVLSPDCKRRTVNCSRP